MTDWDSYGETYRQMRDVDDVPPLLARVMDVGTGDALDMGCGEGVLLTRLSSAYGDRWRLTGFEVSGVRAERARSAGHAVLVDVAGRVPVGDAAADVVVSTHVIEHAPDDAAYAAELARVVRPDGWVYVETPVRLRGAWYFRRSPTAGWVLDPTHVREYRSTADLHAVLAAAGLRVVAEDVTPVAYPLASAVSLLRRGAPAAAAARAASRPARAPDPDPALPAAGGPRPPVVTS